MVYGHSVTESILVLNFYEFKPKGKKRIEKMDVLFNAEW